MLMPSARRDKLRSRIVLLALFTFLFSGALASFDRALAAEGDRPLNVVLILVDDLGWTDLTCYGSEYYETPHLDKLAGQGMRFTDAYAACAVCSPTRAAVSPSQAPERASFP